MKVIILAGGFGTRLGQRTSVIPKPMVCIGEKPILWHIMKIYSFFGITKFIICLGYKGEVIKNYFLHYRSCNNDFTIDLGNDSVDFINGHEENNWEVTLINTGLNTLKGGRLKRVEAFLDPGINLLTYGDGVGNIPIDDLIRFHEDQGKILTLTGVHPPSRFGELVTEENRVCCFEEKPQTSQGFINGGFMVFNMELMNYLTEDENCDCERGPLQELAGKGEIAVYRHGGQWACMDHERDVNYLNELWNSGNAFWKVW